MSREENKVATALDYGGRVTIAAGIVAGMLVLANLNMLAGLAIVILAVISGIFMLGFAENIRLLEEIKNRLPEQER